MSKKLLTLSIILFYSLNSIGQVNKFRAQQVAIKLLQEDGKWSEWSDWDESNSLVTMNSETQRITIYGEPNRTFDIISEEEIEEENGNNVFMMTCIGDNENQCLFKMVYDKDNNLQFYIYYNEAIVVYNVIILD